MYKTKNIDYKILIITISASYSKRSLFRNWSRNSAILSWFCHTLWLKLIS